MKRTLVLLTALFAVSARASGVAALGDISCGIYTNTATEGLSPVGGSWLNEILLVNEISHTPSWWATYDVTVPNASPAPDAAATMGQLKWCVRQTTELLENVATNVGGAGDWLRWTAGNLPPSGNDEAVTVAEFAALVEPVVSRVQQLEIDSAYTPAACSSIEDLFDYGCHSNELVSLAQLKNVFNFDPNGDSYTDGIPDWWQRYYGLITWDEYGSWTDPAADFDWDGSTDYEEWRTGTDPTDRDTDGDGLIDGIDPDPRSWTDPGDYDHDGVPDALETHWFGGTGVVGSASDLDWAGFPFAVALAAGICPTNPPPGTTYPTNGVASLPLVPRFGLEAVSGETVWEVSFDLPRHGAWEQYFLAVTPDPYSDPGTCPSPFSGLSLKWTAQGASGTLAFPAPGYIVPVPVPPGTPDEPSFEITLRLVATRTGLVSCPSPLYFLSYAPALEFPGTPAAMAGGARVSAAVADSDIPFSVDWSLAPAEAAPPADYSDELVFDLFGASFATFTRDEIGRISGGTLCGVPAGVYEFPFIAPPPSRTVPPEIRRILLAVVNPRLAYGNGHGPDTAGIAWDPATGSYARTSEYPLDTEDLWRPFHSDATGCFACDCAPVLTVGIPSEYESLFATNVAVYPSGLRQSATGTVFFAGAPLCVLGADHDPWSAASVATDGLDASCECDGGEVDGHSAGSVRFRLSLGEPRAGQYSGFVWFRSDDGFLVSPSSFELLARADAAVSDATANGTRTIACSDSRGRTVAISPIQNGVSVAVTTTATGEPDHSWTIVNENGSASRIRFVRTSRAGNVQSDRTYILSDGVWSVSDNVAGTTETLVRTDALDDRACPTSSVERVLCDSSGLELSHTFVSSRRYGEGASAVLREIERREDVGTPFEKASFATYWESGGKRFGLPRLVSGDDRAWSWTDYDSKGRAILVFDQRDGSACPADGTGWTLASHPASLKAFATVHSYAPLAGDSNHPDDDATPRTTSRYVVDGASNVLIGKTWTVITHGTNAGLPFVSVRTERAASQSASFGDSANAVSVSVSVDPEAPGVPLLLRGRPLSYTDEDGVTTAYEYAFGSWNPATRTFAASSGASHLRTRVFTTTPETPNGVPLVSTVSETVEDAVHGNEVWSATRVLLANGALSDPFDWEARTYDEQDRLRSTLYSDGSSSTNAYSCCRLLFTVGRDGRKVLRSAKTGTDHLYYAMEEVSLAELPRIATSSLYGGWPQESYRTTQHFMDALGRETNAVTRIGNNPGQATNAVFSAPGDFTASESTEYPYGCDSSAIRCNVRGNYFSTERDDRQEYVSTDRYDDYIWDSGLTELQKEETTTTYRGGGSVALREEGTKWVRTTSFSSYGSDGRRTDVSVTETSDGSCVTNSVSVSDFLGRTARVITPLSDSTYVYDGASSRAISVSDSVSGLSAATIYDALREPVGSVSAGVSSLSNTRYELSSNAWWRVTETREAAGAQTNLLSTVRERLTGLSDSLRSETVSIDESGVATHAVSSFDPATKVLTETMSSPVASTVVRKSMFGRETERTEDGETVRTFYDPFGRVFATRRSGGTGSGAWDRLEAVFIRNSFGDVDTELRPVSPTEYAVTTRNFDSLGNVCFEVDDTGHGRNAFHDLSGRVTQESGDTVYPTKQSYDALGRRVSLSTTRGGSVWDVTRWGYDPATGLCTNKTYADGSRVAHTFAPDGLPLRTTFASGRWTQNAYDASRRVSSVSTSDGEGNVSYLYDAFGRVTRATGAAARYDYARDALGRVTSEARRTGGFHPTIVSTLSRPYDAYGRPAGYGLTFYGDFMQGVCYTWGMDGKLGSMVVSNAQGRAVEITFDWNRGRGVGWGVEGLGDCYAYFPQVFERDAWRPWLVGWASAGQGGFHGGDNRTFSYAFDRLGRPVSRSGDAFAYNARGEVTNAVVGGDAFRYAYDHTGNRQSAYEAGVSTSYSANDVNQYTEVGNDEPEYDEDGNLVDDGMRTFEWSASGRLTEAATPSARLSCVYDHLDRRVSRTTETRSGFRWNLSDEREFVYDGWNLIHERRYDYQDDSDTDIEYFWGPDLSGTLQGAGGVGGLVAVSVDGDFYFPGYDNNGNIIGYWNEDGDLVAEYAYDAFGNTIYEDGDMVAVFPHRFSTKYYDAETDLYYYGYRYYSPSLGRWISRDPIEEEGGLGLYGFCNNAGPSAFDYLGQKIAVFAVAGQTRDVTDADTMEQEIRACGSWIDTKAHFFSKWTVFDSWNEKGNIRIKGKAFLGTREAFVSKVRREKESFYRLLTASDFSSIIRQIESSISDITEPYDRIGIVAHGGWNKKLNRPDGNVWMKDDTGALIASPRESFKSAISNSPILKRFADKIVFVSCFQTWKEPKIRPGETEQAAAIRAYNDSIERPHVTDPDWNIECDQGGMFSDFLPFDFSIRYGE